VTVQQASVCAEYGDGSATRGEVEVDAGQFSGQFVRRIWLEPPVAIHPTVAQAITEFDAAIIGPGSFYTSLMPIFLVRGVAEAIGKMDGPVILIANLLTEGRGMAGFTAADAVSRIEDAMQRHVDVVITNMKWPSPGVLGHTRSNTKEPLGPGNLPAHCELVAEALDERDCAPRSVAARLRGVERVVASAPADARKRMVRSHVSGLKL
jgi:uncharacterized cofD-like protein